MIEELLKEIKTKKNRLQKTLEILNNPTETYLAQYRGQMHEINCFIKLLEKKRENKK